MKVVGVIILVLLYGTIIYFGVKAAKERRAKRYSKFADIVADSCETEISNDDYEEV